MTKRSKTANWKVANGPLRGREFKLEIPSERAQSLKTQSGDKQTQIAVHEAGHATLSIANRESIPEAFRTNSLIPEAEGFIKQGDMAKGDVFFKSDQVKEIAMYLGGLVAEELVFGDHTLSTEGDLREATFLAKTLALRGGHGKNGSLISMEASPALPDNFPRDAKSVEEDVESLLKEAKNLARETLLKQKPFFVALAKMGVKKAEVNRRAMRNLVKKHWQGASQIERILSRKPRDRCQIAFETFERN